MSKFWYNEKFIAFIRPPVIWLLSAYVGVLRKNLPEIQVRRAQSNRPPDFWRKASENSRSIINSWDRIQKIVDAKPPRSDYTKAVMKDAMNIVGWIAAIAGCLTGVMGFATGDTTILVIGLLLVVVGVSLSIISRRTKGVPGTRR